MQWNIVLVMAVVLAFGPVAAALATGEPLPPPFVQKALLPPPHPETIAKMAKFLRPGSSIVGVPSLVAGQPDCNTKKNMTAPAARAALARKDVLKMPLVLPQLAPTTAEIATDPKPSSADKKPPSSRQGCTTSIRRCSGFG